MHRYQDYIKDVKLAELMGVVLYQVLVSQCFDLQTDGRHCSYGLE